MRNDPYKYEIENSPLSRTVSRDGITVEVLIYRSKDEAGWILEVVGPGDASTVSSTTWDEPFDTDEEALAVAIKTIDTEGIVTFMRDPSKPLH
jgi:hypothetical protein